MRHYKGQEFSDDRALSSANLRYVGILLLVALVLSAGFYGWFRHYEKTKKAANLSVLRVFPRNDRDVETLYKLHYISSPTAKDSVIEFRGSFSDLLKLNHLGIPTAAVAEVDYNVTVRKNYPPLGQIENKIHSLAARFPLWAHVDTLGFTAFRHYPIEALEICENSRQNVAKPGVLLIGGLHAREPAGTLFLLALADSLLRGQEKGGPLRELLKKVDLVLVPLVNADGYDYIVKNHVKFPFWRKNLRDNNGDGTFSPAVDGVDLNRNFDFNWGDFKETETSSWFYNGEKPFSEPETQALRNLARRKHFVLMVDYHSYGQSVMFPWTKEMRPPDYDLLHRLALGYARRCRRAHSGRPYDVLPLDGKVGQSANWFYAKFRTLSFIVELGTEYFPPEKDLIPIFAENKRAVLYLIRRIFQTGIEGTVTDAQTNRPLPAIVQLENDFSPVVNPFRADEQFGHFWRILSPGNYKISFQMEGYRSESRTLVLKPGQHKILQVKMQREKPEHESPEKGQT